MLNRYFRLLIIKSKKPLVFVPAAFLFMMVFHVKRFVALLRKGSYIH